ncbi:MAG TPA: malto-oligosyltrehalose trehalohydrolase [Thermoanaerobaculia bacterium]|nr:malto-oligosyltrehalose trehalohydrolase [Thermoanaerobaculia bacterium]
MAGGVSFRVWAPSHERVAVVLDGRDVSLAREDGGYFCAVIAEAGAGTLYRLRVDGANETYPDPASRFQPEGPHGPSQVIDAGAYAWRDRDWSGVTIDDLVLYELHVGTFTREGTYAAAAEHLDSLRDIGINAIELMPLNEFPGKFGWGYDGVDLWAPTRLYGTPDALRRFIDEAHARGIAVLLDVVYNHLGPDGCYLPKFSKSYFTDRYKNEWGEPVNFDGDDARGAREFIAGNAAYWIDEYHFDGLRIDATQSMFDASPRHILQEIRESARDAAGTRKVVLIAENEPQERRILTGYGLDALWNDDWHHSARVAATGNIEAYYSDYRGTAREFVSMARHGFLYQGQHYTWQKKRRGTNSRDLDPRRLVCFLQNHDQVANSARGQRLHELTSPGRYRALTALLLLQPQTPMLFQGQEFGASSPFVYFADHEPELAKLVEKGRADFLRQFPSLASVRFAPPHEWQTFERCKLDHSRRNRQFVALHRDLLRLRREFALAGRKPEASALDEDCFILRWETLLLLVNLGRARVLRPVDEPLLANERRWSTKWSSEAIEYGGSGVTGPETADGWIIPGQAAVLLTA